VLKNRKRKLMPEICRQTAGKISEFSDKFISKINFTCEKTQKIKNRLVSKCVFVLYLFLRRSRKDVLLCGKAACTRAVTAQPQQDNCAHKCTLVQIQ
jgi:hypothetical protein